MPDRQPPVTLPTTNPPPSQPRPNSVHWPIEGATITPGSPAPDNARRHKRSVVPVTFKITLAPSLDLNEVVVLSLLYVVNGSLDYSGLFSQVEISNNSTITFPPGVTEAKVVLHTLPLAPGATFELEVVAYPASAEGVIAVPLGTAEAAEDKSLKALNVLATTALVTALGALAFALLRRSKD